MACKMYMKRTHMETHVDEMIGGEQRLPGWSGARAARGKWRESSLWFKKGLLTDGQKGRSPDVIIRFIISCFETRHMSAFYIIIIKHLMPDIKPNCGC